MVRIKENKIKIAIDTIVKKNMTDKVLMYKSCNLMIWVEMYTALCCIQSDKSKSIADEVVKSARMITF